MTKYKKHAKLINACKHIQNTPKQKQLKYVLNHKMKTQKTTNTYKYDKPYKKQQTHTQRVTLSGADTKSSGAICPRPDGGFHAKVGQHGLMANRHARGLNHAIYCCFATGQCNIALYGGPRPQQVVTNQDTPSCRGFEGLDATRPVLVRIGFQTLRFLQRVLYHQAQLSLHKPPKSF